MDFEDIFSKFSMGVFILFLFTTCVVMVVGTPFVIYDTLYIIPIVEEKANQYCQEESFDFYESYSRVGFLSKEPIAIICKYVEQYRNVDLNINEGGK